MTNATPALIIQSQASVIITMEIVARRVAPMDFTQIISKRFANLARLFAQHVLHGISAQLV